MIGIYKITNMVNGKCYIGKSLDVEKRIYQHKNNINSRPYLQNAISKYGIDNFTFEVIEDNLSKTEYGDREIYWIKYYNSMSPNGYNLTSGGENKPGCKLSDITKHKISIAKMGKKRSLETRMKMSKSAKIKLFTQEHKEHMRLSKLGKNNSFYGKHHTDESKRKMSEKLSGTNSPNYGKIGHMTGKHHSEESKRKIGDHAKINSRNNTNVKNKIWINNGINSKRIDKEDFKIYESKGYKEGRIMNRKCNCICKICGDEFVGKSHNASICNECRVSM